MKPYRYPWPATALSKKQRRQEVESVRAGLARLQAIKV